MYFEHQLYTRHCDRLQADGFGNQGIYNLGQNEMGGEKMHLFYKEAQGGKNIRFGYDLERDFEGKEKGMSRSHCKWGLCSGQRT